MIKRKQYLGKQDIKSQRAPTNKKLCKLICSTNLNLSKKGNTEHGNKYSRIYIARRIHSITTSDLKFV